MGPLSQPHPDPFYEDVGKSCLAKNQICPEKPTNPCDGQWHKLSGQSQAAGETLLLYPGLLCWSWLAFLGGSEALPSLGAGEQEEGSEDQVPSYCSLESCHSWEQ